MAAPPPELAVVSGGNILLRVPADQANILVPRQSRPPGPHPRRTSSAARMHSRGRHVTSPAPTWHLVDRTHVSDKPPAEPRLQISLARFVLNPRFNLGAL
jgi:hypothetical protein